MGRRIKRATLVLIFGTYVLISAMVPVPASTNMKCHGYHNVPLPHALLEWEGSCPDRRGRVTSRHERHSTTAPHRTTVSGDGTTRCWPVER
jgi:hypothetical protein